MANIVTTIPQNTTPIIYTTRDQVMTVLPDTIPFLEPIGIGGKITQGKQIGTIIFQVGTDEAPTPEMKAWANDIAVQASGGAVAGTMSNDWRNRLSNIIWIYNNGEKILGNDYVYTKAPPALDFPLGITWDILQPRFPTQLPEEFVGVEIYATGSVVRDGISFNDFDLVAGTPIVNEDGTVSALEPVDKTLLFKMHNYFSKVLNVNTSVYDRLFVDVGNVIMAEREPVNICKIYDANGLFCYPAGA